MPLANELSNTAEKIPAAIEPKAQTGVLGASTATQVPGTPHLADFGKLNYSRIG